MKEVIKSNASRFGLIAAALSVLYVLAGYLVDLKILAGTAGNLVLWLVTLILLIVAVSQAKKGFGGFISFRDAFATFMVAYIIYALVYTAFNIVLFGVVDTEAADKMQEITIQKTVDTMESMGSKEGQIEKMVESMENTDAFSPLSQVKSFFYQVIVYAIIGLIVAAFMKKNPPPEYYQPETEDQ